MKEYLTKHFKKDYEASPDVLLSCGGRFEVLGNHTDHNHGLCIAATCDLSIYCAAKKRDDLLVQVHSEGYRRFKVDLTSLSKKDKEKGTPAALIRGISAYLSKDYKIGGFDIYIKSNIPSGAGVSSSAAFELLIAQTINVLFNKNKIPLMTLSKAGRFAEKEYYDKMCGLLDQIGVAWGGLVYIDFKDINNPVVENIKINLKNHQFIIVNTGGSHATLSHLYAAIPADMRKVANFFGKDYLREVDYELVKKNEASIVETCGGLPYQRAIHFFEEDLRVEKAIAAIKQNKIHVLIDLMNQSRISSTELLKNMYIDEIAGSPLEACNIVLTASEGKAGVKINGGGFAGSVVALVPNKYVKAVCEACKDKYGKKNVHLVGVRNDKPTILK